MIEPDSGPEQTGRHRKSSHKEQPETENTPATSDFALSAFSGGLAPASEVLSHEHSQFADPGLFEQSQAGTLPPADLITDYFIALRAAQVISAGIGIGEICHIRPAVVPERRELASCEAIRCELIRLEDVYLAYKQPLDRTVASACLRLEGMLAELERNPDWNVFVRQFLTEVVASSEHVSNMEFYRAIQPYRWMETAPDNADEILAGFQKTIPGELREKLAVWRQLFSGESKLDTMFPADDPLCSVLTNLSLSKVEPRIRGAREKIRAGSDAEWSLYMEFEELIGSFESQKQELQHSLEESDSLRTSIEFNIASLEDHITELRAARTELLRCFRGEVDTIDTPSVLVGERVSEATTTRFGEQAIRAVLARIGNRNHIINEARLKRFPIVSPDAAQLAQLQTLPSGTTIIVDAENYRLLVNPSETILEMYQQKLQSIEEQYSREVIRRGPVCARTRAPNSIDIDVQLNIDGVFERVQDFVRVSRCSVGLTRTESVFRNTGGPATEPGIQEETFRRLYRSVADNAAHVTVRTWDYMHDKMDMRSNEVPRMGQQVGLTPNNVSEQQLTTMLYSLIKAALREKQQARILFPNVSSPIEMQAHADAVFVEAFSLFEVLPAPDVVSVGFMVESIQGVRNTRAILEQTKPRPNFVAIGSNDLGMELSLEGKGAVTDQRIDHNVDDHNPELYRQIRQVIQQVADFNRIHFHQPGFEPVTVTLCGMLAAIEEFAPVLLGLGLRKFSVDPDAAHTIASAISSYNLEACEDLAAAICAASDSREIQQLLTHFQSLNPRSEQAAN